LPGLRLAKRSGLYFTEPQDEPDQPWFVNQVVEVVCDETWTARKLLAELLRIEVGLGRVRDLGGAGRFGPRPLDLDLLLFGQLILDEPELILPHPRMRLRAFVLVPLAEIAPGLVFPDGERIDEALAKIAFQANGNVIGQR
jgi:2-amino-4-hydroxy-6-hydroxymethyldihydropteridine diphosphokinase